MLAGLGAVAAAPLFASWSARSADAVEPTRLLILYLPNGMRMDHWRPPAGASLPTELPPALRPLAAHRSDLTVISGLWSPDDPDMFDRHGLFTASALTGERLARQEVLGATRGWSLDQLVAASRPGGVAGALALCAEGALPCVPGGPFPVEMCPVNSVISWRGPTRPVAPESDPAVLRRRLFGDPADEHLATPRSRRRRLIASDLVAAEATRLLPSLASADRSVMEGWLEAVASYRARLESGGTDPGESAAFLEASVDASATGRLIDDLGDLAVLSLASGETSVATLMLGRELSNHVLPVADVPLGHHPVSHHADSPDLLRMLGALCAWEVGKVARIVDQLASLPTSDGNRLLDHTLVLLMAGFGDPQVHDGADVPVALLGGQATGLAHGRHVDAVGRPLADLHLALGQRLGLELDSFGASGGSPLLL
jgi:hypothetical protein